MLVAAILSLGIAWLTPASPARAACGPEIGGVVTCTGIVPPILLAEPPVSTVNVNALTGNIAAFGPGQAAVSLTSTRATPASPGGSPVVGGDGDDGPSAGGVNINLVGPGGGFSAGASDGFGIEARSVGANGARGGNGTGALLAPGIGGDGGSGGAGGAVSIVTTGGGVITTAGDNHHGILGLSQGGNGGDGGSGDVVFDVLDAIYGEGGDGGAGGSPNNVMISNTLDIQANGTGSAGIWAQSVGARGGHGGIVTGTAIGVGGDGAASSSGGVVNVTSGGQIATTGWNAYGIYAQSVGGFSGSGGGAYGLLSFGGSPASAGNGGPVTVGTLANSAITTIGQNSAGIYVQSVGGGGGAGGTGAGLVGFGGGGGGGGNGQTVTLTNRSVINTSGDGAGGIIAQSVGGGGGAGGTAVGVAALGGNGGGGGNGGVVNVGNSNTIQVRGNGAGFELGNYGIFAQSVGGGGGSANITAGVFAMGGAGGAAGNGDNVTVSNTGNVSSLCTAGNCSFSGAIYAQSVGGGGGRGAGTGGLVAIGGAGGGGGSAGEVRVDNSGVLVANGNLSRGIFAQSVGGGGGDGGFTGGLFALGLSGANGGDGRYVGVRNAGGITTTGTDSAAIFAQSVGGGGGNGGNVLAVGAFAALGFGGKGGGGGNGADVDVNRYPDPASIASVAISTHGDRSAGILAQSVGGGGGNGGFAIAASGGIFFSGSLAFGGSGGSGGNAGNVYVGSRGSIDTVGSFASGIIAESIGGGGGRGGFAISAAGSNGGAISLSFGGTGGGGGTGGLVEVQNFSNITVGCAVAAEAGGCTQSNGILASSIGGGGGTGGFAIAGGGALVGAAALTFGGDGGAGNNGQAVKVNSAGNISTVGSFSNGIMAQSLGGGGGNAGFAVSGSFSVQGANASLAFGGAGGEGSFGGSVDVANAGNITTAGDFSNGILAQSIGGGGGTGGFAGTIGFSVNGGSAALAFGGDGGTGSEGRDVTVRHAGDIRTSGKQAAGIFAQSIGGGGGTAGFALSASGTLKQPSAVAALGGEGGAGGISGKVAVTDVFGSITTTGEQSHGIFAQSVGGGGGWGGFAASANFSLDSDTYGYNVGGSGGSGRDGGEVLVVSNAAIDTGGLAAHGILAQSIGGGGGTAGFSASATLSIKGNANTNSTGGDGAVAGSGRNVTVSSNGSIITRADSSIGIFAQSVGGGGGAGGFSVGFGASVEGDAAVDSVGGKAGAAGDAGEVRVAVNGNIDTQGALSHGVLAQSVGGGGGFGGFSIGLGGSWKGDSNTKSVGGEGAGGGRGGYVEVIVGSDGQPGVPTIHTRGLGAVGVLAQSIGGGGGAGGFAGALSIAPDGKTENDVGGGRGGDGSSGGHVVVRNFGTIITESNNAAGILAQSIGGGGGNGGFSIAGAFESEGDGAKNSVGGDGGFGAMGGTVEVTNAGTILTGGDFSHGIFAQSVGGGGGNGGFSIAGTISDSGSGATSSVGGSGASGGDGGTVIVTNTGTISVTGQNSQGIFAQSVGGSGGSGGFAGAFDFGGGGVDNLVGGDGAKGGNGGNVTVVSTGSIHTATANSTGVFAQSVGGSGGWAGLAIGVGDGGSGSSGISIGLGSKCTLVGDDGDATTEGCDIAKLIPVDGSTGTVTVTINGETNVTEGALSYGMLAQSIAGGGGAAATVILDQLNFSGSDIVLAAGNDGSMGGNASFANNTYETDHTSTAGVGAIGLIVQSIGGGGGVVGNANTALVLNPTEPPEDGFYLTAGGTYGGAGFDFTGSGGGFMLDAAGTVATSAANAIGIVGQTIGGGGGIVNLTATSVTNEGDELAIVVGGSHKDDKGYFANAGSPSTLTAGALVSTGGALSHGIVAQSIGGGGGVSNAVFENGVQLRNGTHVTIGGGQDGDGGIGGDLNVTASGVTTTGNGAFGIVVQSIGGGGGLTGVASGAYVLGQDGFSLTPVTIAGGGGPGGNSGFVTIASNGSVHTAGFGAHGIVAQSIAGGGGIVGNGMFATDIADASAVRSFAGSVGGAGTAANVSVTETGNVVVTGARSVGIFGQSAAGDASDNRDVALTVDHAGTNGNGVGLIWASAGNGAAVQIADGRENFLTSNGTLYAERSVVGGGAPIIAGLAVLGGSGNDVITNVGRFPTGAYDNHLVNGTRTSNIIGNVDLGAGANRLVNQTGALFISGADLTLGDGSTLTNEGLLAPGDRGVVATSAVLGNVNQTSTGVYYVDLDLNAQNTPSQVNDLLDIDGSGAFAGEGAMLWLSINKAFSNDGYVVARSTGPMTESDFTPTLQSPTVGFNFSAEVFNGTDLTILAEKPPFVDLLKDPASGTKDPNVWAMGSGLDNIEQAVTVDDEFNYLINLLRLQPDAKALGDAVTTLTPHQAPHVFELAARQANEFLDHSSNGCRDSLLWAGPGLPCLWATDTLGEYDRDSVYDSPIAEDRWHAFALGGQVPVNATLDLGFGLDLGSVFSEHTRHGLELSTMSGNIYQASVSASYHDNNGFGAVFVASGGTTSDFETARRVKVDGFTQTYESFDGIGLSPDLVELPVFSEKTIEFEGIDGTASSEVDLLSFNPRLRLSYASALAEGVEGAALLDIDGYVMRTEERTETGVGLANLTYPEMTQALLTVTPSLELRLSHELDNGYLVSAFARGGLQWAPFEDQWIAETQFAAAPDGLPPIAMVEPFDELRAKLNLGLTVSCPVSGASLTMNYAGTLGATSREHELKAGLSFPIGASAGC